MRSGATPIVRAAAGITAIYRYFEPHRRMLADRGSEHSAHRRTKKIGRMIVLVRVRQEVQALLWQTHAALTAKALLPPARTSYVGPASEPNLSGTTSTSTGRLWARCPDANLAVVSLALFASSLR